jgi:hypothetical protein
MSVTPQGLMRVINGLSGPLKSKAIKLLDKYVPKNVDAKGNVRNPLRKQSDKQAKSQKAVEGQRRYTVGELKGIVKGVAGTSAVAATYTAGDLINDLLGIKKMGDGTLRAEEKKKVGKSNSETKTNTNKKVIKKTPPKAPPPKPNSIKPKKKQLMMKDKSGKDTNVKFNYKGGMLKKGKK